LVLSHVMFFGGELQEICTMGMIYIMLIVSLVIALFFLCSFFWATKTGQFDDDYAPSVRILFDDETNNKSNNKNDGNPEI
jgi:cbb3-type cytochrome oxidase maturation protein